MASSATGSVSGVVRLTDLNDFISPSQSCIKPVEIPKSSKRGGTIAIEADGGYVEVSSDGSRQKLAKAAVTLNDCLACSGCVTSAESVLVELQNHAEFVKELSAIAPGGNRGAGDGRLAVVSLSPQSTASVAARYGVTMDQAARRLTGFLKRLGVAKVFDTSFGRAVSLVEAQREFLNRYKAADEGAAGTRSFPVLVSACPGWICFAEKTHGDFVLPHISTVKSAQQVMGSVVKSVVGAKAGVEPGKVYHVTVMPCLDKKLEASRDDFYSDVHRTRDVDCVITTGELELLLQGGEVDFGALPELPFDSPVVDGEARTAVGHRGGSSGGFLEHVFTSASAELFGIESPPIKYTSKRNPDFRDVTLTIDGDTKLRFAAAYGFKSIQNVIRQMKRGKCPYHYIEIMACPKGCNNGGGQLKPGAGAAEVTVSDVGKVASVEAGAGASAGAAGPMTSTGPGLGAVPRGDTVPRGDPKVELLAEVDRLYHTLPIDERPGLNPDVEALYSSWVQTDEGEDRSSSLLHTQYHAVEKTVIPQLEQW